MTHALCAHCGLACLGGPGPEGAPRFCCYGCGLAYRIVGDHEGGGEAAWLLARLGLAVFLSMNVMTFSWLFYTHTFEGYPDAARVVRVLMVLMATPVVVILGLPFLQRAIAECRTRSWGMDSLIALGVFSAYAYSIVSFARGEGDLYLDTGLMILVLVTLGRLLEAQAKVRARSQVKRLVALQPPEGRIVRNGVRAVEPIERIGVGETLEVLPGERIGLDGVVVEGAAEVDHSVLTGESVPCVKGVGDRVFGGGIAVDGRLLVRVDRPHAATLLAEVIRIVERAQTSRMPIQRLADRVSSRFVPLVVAVAVGAGGWWAWHGAPSDGVMTMLAVLVVACPCAIGLAGPLAAVIGLGRAAEDGVLIRAADALERLAKVSVVCWDKTGTLTQGSPRLVAAHPVPGLNHEELLTAAASLARYSEHPIARAIISAGPDQGLYPVQDVRAMPGRGTVGIITRNHAREEIRVGSGAWIREGCGGSFEDSAMVVPSGYTTVFCAVGGRTLGALLLDDPLRPGAREAVAALASRGIRSVLLSGDQPAVAGRVAEAAGIPEQHAGLLPQEKVDRVDALRRQGETVLMVGDGINDAPVLAVADVGLTLGCATDLAKETAGVTLLASRLATIPWLLEYAARVRRTIQWNLVWAFAYNVVGVGLAVAGLLQPVLAALAMVLSSFFVVGNSLRLLRNPPSPLGGRMGWGRTKLEEGILRSRRTPSPQASPP